MTNSKGKRIIIIYYWRSGGKDMSLLSVITQEMTNDQLVIRNHYDDLNTKSQLIVYESQEAIFYKDGQALDLFGPGRHVLNTENLPIIKRAFGALFGGKTPFPCDVYFFNKVNVLDIMWGTDSPIDLNDPEYDVLIGVRANGQTGIRIKDSRMFAVKVVGMLKEYGVDTLKKTIKGLMMASIKECIAAAIIEKGVSILNITPMLTEIAALIQNKLNPRIADLGLEIVHFNLNGVLASDGDLDDIRKAKNAMVLAKNEAKMEAFKMKTLSEARAQARQTEGYTYMDERRFDILEGAAKNEGAAGGFVNMGVGLGMGFGVSKEVGKMTEAMATQQPANQAAPTVMCAGCGTPLDPGAKFCPECGQPRPQNKFCTQCGAQLTPGAKFCPECGSRLQ